MSKKASDFSFSLRRQIQRKIALVFSIILIVFVFIKLIISFVLFPISVNSEAMEPEYPQNCLVFIKPIEYKNTLFWQKTSLKRGSVVYLDITEKETRNLINQVFDIILDLFSFRKYKSQNKLGKITNTPSIRRVIGLPGDTIYMKDYVLYIKPKGETHFLTEFELSNYPYETNVKNNSSHDKELGTPGDMYEISLSEHDFFVLADNRISGYDSRLYGSVNENKITGKALLRYFPFKNFKYLK